MFKRLPIAVAILMLAIAGIGLYLALRPSKDEIRLEALRDSIHRDARAYRERQFARPVLFGSPEDGCAVERFRESLKGIADSDVVCVPDLEEYIALPSGHDEMDIVKRLKWTAATMVGRYPKVLEDLMRAARQRVGNRPHPNLSVDAPQGASFLSLSARMAILLLLADARLKAEGGEFAGAVDRCTAALVLSLDLSRGALFQDVLASIMLHHLSLKGLTYVIDVGKPAEPDLKEIKRRIDVLMFHTPPAGEAFEHDLLRRRLIRLSQAESREEKNVLAIRDVALNALQEFDGLLQRYRSISGTTYKERRDALQKLDRDWRASSNPLVRGFEFELDAFEQQRLGLVAEQRMLMILCDREIDRLKNPAAAPEILPMPDPFDGQPLRAHAQGGVFRVYSVGPDLIDQQGTSGDLVLEIRR
jgi:hypothetical protein